MNARAPSVALAAALSCTLATPTFAQPGQPPDAAGDQLPPNAPGTLVIVAPAPPVAMAAPPPPYPVAPPPPQTHDWRNVSHINGQIVKVGEQGDYLYDNGKHTSIASNPIGWMFGFYGLSISHAVHGNVAIRADVNVYDVGNTSGHELGISAPIYFRRTFQGPFLEPGLVARNLDDCDGCREHVGPEMLFGWQWSFDSGLNVAMALGAMRDLSGDSHGAEPNGYFRIGYLF